jgi:hypothetical protein
MPDDLLKVYDTGEMSKIVAREICKFASHKQMKTAWKKAARAKGSKAQLARLEVYRKALANETRNLLGDVQEVDSESKKAAKNVYRKLTVAVEKAVDENLLSDENKYLMVAMNSRHLAKVEDLAKSLAKIAKHLADGCTKARNQG